MASDQSFAHRALPTQLSGLSAVDVVLREKPSVFCVFVRRKNGNLVVLEAKTQPGQLLGVDSYWLDLEPSYRVAARKAGRVSDRVELGLLDSVYGFACERTSPSTLRLRMNQFHALPLLVQLHGDGTCSAQIMIANQTCRLHHIYVHDNTRLGIPYVEYVEVFGTNPQGATLSQRL
jgi:hypothetical protein